MLVSITALFGAMGLLTGGVGGIVTTPTLACAMNMFTYWNPDQMLLRMHNDKHIEPVDMPELHNIVVRLARNAEIPTPKFHMMHTPHPNAFATGRPPKMV